MNSCQNFFQSAITALAALLFLGLGSTASAQGMAGWEAGSAYNALYNPKEIEKLTGEITKFMEVTPLPGMAPGTAFLLAEGADTITVHLCPVAFAGTQETGLQKGVKTKLRGSWAVIDDKDVFMAAKVKQGDHFEFKVRLTKDGTPFWTLSPEELSKEQEND